MNYEACTTITNDPRIVVKENKSRFEVENKSRSEAKKVKVDGCLIGGDVEKCDWIISFDSPVKRAMFIELKGCNFEKALSQLKSTLNITREAYSDYARECFVVTTRIPKFGQSVQVRSRAFYKDTKATLSVKNINEVVIV